MSTPVPDAEMHEFYAKLKPQPGDCPNCSYLSYGQLSETVEKGGRMPEGFEHMINIAGAIKQCAEHNVPLHPWLAAVEPTKAMDWLREDGKKHTEPYQIDFDAWQKAVS